MTSQGQRFRRRSLRRGYRVEEVDTFLDRVEATLNGERVDPPVRASEVHDIVFRVKFGGYDEWQVDLHLDRVERQLAEQEPGSSGSQQMPPDRMPDRGFDRMPVPERGPGGMAGRDDRTMPPERAGFDRPGFDRPGFDRPGFDRPGGPMAGGQPGGRPGPGGPMGAPGSPGSGMPVAGMPAAGMPPLPNRPGPGTNAPTTNFPRYDDRGDRGEQPEGSYGTPPGSYPPPGYRNAGYGGAPPTFGGGTDQPRPDRPGPGRPGPDQPRSDRPGPDQSRPAPGVYGTDVRGVPADRTAEMRVPPPPGGPSNRPSVPGGFSGPGQTGPAQAPGGPGGPSQPSGPPLPPEAQHVDQLRRTFQPRRFGSGYDRAEVDNLFEGILATFAGRGRPVADAELDSHRFNLVPGGYYEDEVDEALRQVRDMLRRR